MPFEVAAEVIFNQFISLDIIAEEKASKENGDDTLKRAMKAFKGKSINEKLDYLREKFSDAEKYKVSEK